MYMRPSVAPHNAAGPAPIDSLAGDVQVLPDADAPAAAVALFVRSARLGAVRGDLRAPVVSHHQDGAWPARAARPRDLRARRSAVHAGGARPGQRRQAGGAGRRRRRARAAARRAPGRRLGRRARSHDAHALGAGREPHADSAPGDLRERAGRRDGAAPIDRAHADAVSRIQHRATSIRLAPTSSCAASVRRSRPETRCWSAPISSSRSAICCWPTTTRWG